MTSFLRVAALAGVLALSAPFPLQAQTVHFGFGLGFDSDVDDDDASYLSRRLCILTDRGLRNAIDDQGYDDIYLNVPTGRYVEARASRGDWVYLLKVNACTGLIVGRERLRRSD